MLIITLLLSFFITIQTVDLSINLVNRGENIIIPLQSYLKNVSKARIDSSRNEPPDLQKTLHIKIQDPLTNVFNVTMKFQINDQTKYLSDYEILQSKQIYNQPLKIFLLSNNTILLLIYHEHSCQKEEDVQIIPYQINHTSSNCTELEVMEDISSYSALVMCKNSKNNQIEVIWYKLTENNQGYVEGIREIDTKPLPPITSEQYEQLQDKPTCNVYGIKFFKNITIGHSPLQYKSFVYCKQAYNGYNYVHSVTLLSRNKLSILSFSPTDKASLMCFTNATKIFQYENGFIAIRIEPYSFRYPALYQFIQLKPDNDGSCNRLFELDGYLHATSQTEKSLTNGKENIQIFVIFPDRVIVKESSLANKQTYIINPEKYEITSYALTSQYLFIQYKQSNFSSISVYTLTEPTLREIDQIYTFSDLQRALSKTTNYLQSSSYFFVHDWIGNVLYLTKYDGNDLNIKVSDSHGYQRNNKLVITTADPESENDETSQQLIIHMTITDIDSQEIIKNHVKTYRFDSQIFKIDLSKLYIGPTPRFYIKNQSYSHLQFINQFQSLSIANFTKYNNLSLIEIAINTELQYPVISFFYPGLYQMTCSLIFNYSNALFQVGKCGKAIQLKTDMEKPKRVLVLAKNRYLQFNDTRIQLCSITSTNEVNICQKLYEDTFNVKRIKLVSYFMTKNLTESIELIIIGQKMAFYAMMCIEHGKVDYKLLFNVTNKEISQLDYMEIRELYIDPGYKKYMVLHLEPLNETSQKNQMGVIKVFDRPIVSPDKKKFIGHLIGEIQDPNIQGVMYITTLDLLIVITQIDNVCTIKEYHILTSYQLVLKRQYPTYGKQCRKGSFHVSDGNKVFMQYISANKSTTKQYYVYEPSQATTNLFIYNFVIDIKNEIQFVQKIGSSGQTIGRINDTIFTIGLPELIYSIDKQQFDKLLSSPKSNDINGTIQLALVQKIKSFSLVTIPYRIDTSNYQIKYKSQRQQEEIIINDQKHQYSFSISPQAIQGPVTNYSMSSNCQFALIKQQDLFDKIQCIQYYDSLKYGVMFDFVTFKIQQTTIQLIVTNRYYICIQNRKDLFKKKRQSIAQRCNMTHKDNSIVFVVCVVNQNSMIQILEIKNNSCSSFTNKNVDTPQWLKYQYFGLKYSLNYVIFQVPVRVSYQSYEYFCCKFNQTTKKLSDSYTILSRIQKKTGNEQYQFASLDYTLGNGFIFVLEDGIGIFEMSYIDEKHQTLPPGRWLNKSYIYQIIKSQQDKQPLVYIDSIPYVRQYRFRFELGTKTHSYEMQYDYKNDQLSVIYTYLQISYCFNTVNSKPRTMRNMTVRICSFQPQKFSIFGNFYPIMRLDKLNYLQFFTKNDDNQSYPFRMESINSDFFVVNDRNSYMCTGSLLNFACYYTIRTQVSWKIKYNGQGQNQENVRASSQSVNQQQSCQIDITIMNQNCKTPVTLKIVNNVTKDKYMWQQWIMRGVFILFLINFIRMWRKYRKENKKNKRKHYADMFSNEFERQLNQYKKKQT